MPSLFHPRGLFHFFWWPSDSRLFSQGNEQIWWNDLKAVLDAFFIRGQRGCSWGCGERGTVPCISTNMQQPWGTEPPGEVEPPLYALSGQDRDWQHISTKMKKKKKGGGTWHITYVFLLPPSPLYCASAPYWVPYQELHSIWGIKPERG